MRVYVRTLTLLAALLGANGALAAQELREDSYRWYIGPQGGVLMFQTQTQDYSSIPSAGFHILVMGKRAGLQLSVDEALGSDESSAFGDATAPNGAREVTFDHLRKYSANVMLFPLRRASSLTLDSALVFFTPPGPRWRAFSPIPMMRPMHWPRQKNEAAPDSAP